MKTLALAATSLAFAVAAAVHADGTWQVVTTGDGVTPVPAPGMGKFVWVPNEFNNPSLDESGNVYFRGRFAGPGVTTANSRAIFRFEAATGSWSVIAREGSPLPGGLLPGLVINTTSGVSGLASGNMITRDGGVIVAGSVNGPGVTSSNNDFNAFVSASGTASLLSREGDAYPGASGVLMTVAQLSSGVYCNNGGVAMAAVTLTGSGVVTGTTPASNNAAIVQYTPTGTQVLFRRGDAAPGAGVDDQWDVPAGSVLQPSTFGLFLNGSTYGFSGKLAHPTAGTIVTTSDDVWLVNTGSGLRIFARDGSEIPGFPGITFKQVSDFSPPVSWSNHPIRNDGAVLFYSNLGGAVTPTVDDVGVLLEQNGTYTFLLRRGESIPGVTDGTVLSGPNTSAFLMNANGLLCFQGILMNPNGTSIDTNSTFVGYRKADGTKGVIIRQGDPIPGIKGATASSLNGSTSISLSDSGVCVFNVNASGGSLGANGGSVIMAWDEYNGARVIAATGDASYVGIAANQISLIGSTGNNGNGHNTGINPSGKLAVRFADTMSAIYKIATIELDAAPPCPADVDGDGAVDSNDLAAVLAGWGSGSPDLDDNGIVDALDLAFLLSSWGPCQ